MLGLNTIHLKKNCKLINYTGVYPDNVHYQVIEIAYIELPDSIPKSFFKCYNYCILVQSRLEG